MRKAKGRTSIPVSVSMTPEMKETAQRIAAGRGFNSVSNYVCWLIQRDVEGGVAREDVLGLMNRAANKSAPAQIEDSQQTTPRLLPAHERKKRESKG